MGSKDNDIFKLVVCDDTTGDCEDLTLEESGDGERGYDFAIDAATAENPLGCIVYFCSITAC